MALVGQQGRCFEGHYGFNRATPDGGPDGTAAEQEDDS